MSIKAILIGSAAVLALAVPAVAQMTKSDRPAQTRAEAEAKVRERFARIDADNDGYVTAQDVSAMRGAAMTKMFDRMDADKNGSVSRAEFDAAHAGGKHGKGAGHGRKTGWGGGRMMMMADADKDGRVAVQEAVNGALAMFDRADTNKDGTLTQDERRAARQAMREMWRGRTAS